MRFSRIRCTREKPSGDSTEIGRKRLFSAHNGGDSGQQADFSHPGHSCNGLWFWRAADALPRCVLPALLLLATPAAAQSGRFKNIGLCNGGGQIAADSVITGCTALIDSGAETPKTLAIVYSNRGNAFIHKGEYDHAIRDYEQSIKNEPEYAKAFNNRGVAYQKKGEHQLAMQDFEQAIKLDPKYAGAFVNRARARRARTFPWTRMRQFRALSRLLVAYSTVPSWADCITNMRGFDLRQAQRCTASAAGF
jgi:tetratricopeptide (TPR) repeat protein